MEKRKNLLQLWHPDLSRSAGEGDFFKETRRQCTDKGFRMTSRWIFLAVFAFLTSLGCSSNEIENLPRELLGHWETNAPKFNGFSFELSKEALSFTDLNAENGIEFYIIQKRTKDLDKKNNVYYTVYYENKEGLEFKFALYYDLSGGGKIILKNQKAIVWTRVPKS